VCSAAQGSLQARTLRGRGEYMDDELLIPDHSDWPLLDPEMAQALQQEDRTPEGSTILRPPADKDD
jgi:hypothetical protein